MEPNREIEVYAAGRRVMSGMGRVAIGPGVFEGCRGSVAFIDDPAAREIQRELEEAHALIELLVRERTRLLASIALWQALYQQLAAFTTRLQRALHVLRMIEFLRG